MCVFECTCGGGGWYDWEAVAEEECVYTYIGACVRALMCVLERGPTPMHLFFCRVLWCHPPTSPLCFHTSVSHTAALFVGRCVHAVPNGRYFELEFCLPLPFQTYLKRILSKFLYSTKAGWDCEDSAALLLTGSLDVKPQRKHLPLYHMQRRLTIYILFISSSVLS